MIANDTYGEITAEELADLRAHAKRCQTCGMLATVDPAFHATCYGHAPQFTDARGHWMWDQAAHRWDIGRRSPWGDDPPGIAIAERA